MSNTLSQQQVEIMSKEADKFSKMSVVKIAKEFDATLTSVGKVRKFFETKGLYPKYQRLTLKDMVDAALAETDTEEENTADGGEGVEAT